MSKLCFYCGKHKLFGNKVSFSHRTSRRTWSPNLRRVKAVVDGTTKRVYVCTKCLKSGKVQRAI
ncbi:MAG: 50S ribosomal protein L28 [Tissierellia bacterium]|nr:50S ribosomal protein L28 [Tissierellia bacterium]